MSFLDPSLRKIVKIAGEALRERRHWNFVSGVTGVDNPITGETDLTVIGGGDPEVADDIGKASGVIRRVLGIHGNSIAGTYGTAPPVGGTFVRTLYGGDSLKAKRPSPHGWFDVHDYGAIGDGASHPLSDYFASLGAAQAVFPHANSLTNELDWAAIQAAINAAKIAEPKTGGNNALCGRVHIGRGHFLCDQSLDMKQTKGMILAGAGRGIGGGGVATDGSSTLFYTGSGRRFIDCRSTFGYRLQDLSIQYSSLSFFGHLVDLSHSNGNDPTNATFIGCHFSGANSISITLNQGCKSLLFMHGAIACVIDNCIFTVGHQGIRFRNMNGAYSNSHVVSNCQFVFLEQAMVNGGQDISIHGCTFEGSGGQMTSAYEDDPPQSRATPTDTFTFAGSIITRAGPGSFLTDGFFVGADAVQSLQSSNIATNGFPSQVVRVTDTELDFSQNTLIFSGDTITRSYGSFIDDGWILGMKPTISIAGSDDNGELTPITFLNATTMTCAGTSLAATPSATWNTGSVYHLLENEYDAHTVATPGWTFVAPETTSTAYLFMFAGAGPLSIKGCWFGDQFLSTSWIKLQNATAFSMSGNYFDGNDRVLDVQFSAQGVHIAGNVLGSPSPPLQFGTESGAKFMGSADGITVQGNAGHDRDDLVSFGPGYAKFNVIVSGNGDALSNQANQTRLFEAEFQTRIDAKAQATYREPASVTTADDVATAIGASFDLTEGKTAAGTAIVTAARTDGGASSAWSVAWVIKNNAGTLSLVGLAVVPIGQDDPTWGGPDITFSGTTIQPKVTGLAATSITWGIVHTRLEIYGLPAPTISSVTPSSGASSGMGLVAGPAAGTVITDLHGTGFVTGCTVKFGDFPATSVAFVSSVKLTCVTPEAFATVPGYVTVRVTNPDGQNTGDSGADLFKYT